MNKQLRFLALSFLLILTVSAISFGQEKLGKIFIKAATSELNGQQFPDAGSEDSVKDMKKRPGKFILAYDETTADFLLVVIERKAVAVSGQPASKTILATLSFRDGAEWKPATKIQSGVKNIFWGLAAENVIKDAENWVKANASVHSISNQPSIDLTPFVGRYNSQDPKSGDYFELKSDGALFLQQKGKRYKGTFDIKDNLITFAMPGITSEGVILGDTITDSEKGKWTKQKH